MEKMPLKCPLEEKLPGGNDVCLYRLNVTLLTWNFVFWTNDIIVMRRYSHIQSYEKSNITYKTVPVGKRWYLLLILIKKKLANWKINRIDRSVKAGELLPVSYLW